MPAESSLATTSQLAAVTHAGDTDQSRIAAELRGLLYHWWRDGTPVSFSDKIDFYGRSIISTPFGGKYSNPAGWVITVEGTPLRGTLHISGGDSMHFTAYYIGDNKSRRIHGTELLSVIKRFMGLWLNDADRVVTIEGQPLSPVASGPRAGAVREHFDDDADRWHWCG